MSVAGRLARRRLGLPPARSGVLESEVWMPAPDGARLACRWLRPAASDLREGCVLIRSERPADPRAPLEQLARWLAEDGRSVLIQSCRGRDASEGHFRPFADEVEDGGAALRWLAEQPGCDGPPLLVGLGYSAFCAWAALAAEPERVAGLAVGFGARDPYAWLRPGGVLQLEAALALAARLDGRQGFDPSELDLERAGRHRPLAECDRVALRELSAFQDWLAHDERDAWWRERSPGLPERLPPTLHWGGWYDCALAAGWADYQRLADAADAKAAPRPSLVIGPWGPAPPRRAWRREDPGPLAAVARSLLGFAARSVGGSALREPPARIFVHGSGWQQASVWPPMRASFRSWQLRGDAPANSLAGGGRLEVDPPGDEAPERFVADPSDPVPSLGGARFTGPAGPVDQREVEARADVLCFSSAPLAEPLELAGRAELTLYTECEQAPFDSVARLVAVDAEGCARWLAEGCVRAREGDATGPLQLAIGVVGARLEAGSRLRLEIAGSSLPRFERCEADASTRLRVVHHDAQRPSALRIECLAALDRHAG